VISDRLFFANSSYGIFSGICQCVSPVYYQIKVESSQALFSDGTVLPCACDRVERIFAAHVTAINVAPFDAKVEVAA
jgi:hypothetical protein